MDERQVLAARQVAKAASIYKNYILDENILGDEFHSLKTFLTGYAYERNVAVKIYRDLAVKALEMTFLSKKIMEITENDAEQAWKTYKDLKEKIYDRSNQKLRLNPLRNPMNVDCGILARMAERHIVNLSTFLLTEIKANNAREAHDFLREIRGIGAKIASFYLRDLVFQSKMDEATVNECFLLQPVDVWVNQVVEIIAEDAKEKTLIQKQQLILQLCSESNVSAIDFNTGAWVLGSIIARDADTLSGILKYGLDSLDAIIENQKNLFRLRNLYRARALLNYTSYYWI